MAETKSDLETELQKARCLLRTVRGQRDAALLETQEVKDHILSLKRQVNRLIQGNTIEGDGIPYELPVQCDKCGYKDTEAQAGACPFCSGHMS